MRTRFESLTREEILELTETDVEYYKRYALAENGVVLPPEAGEEPVKPEIPAPTIVVYECRGILTTDPEEAKAIATLTSVCYEDYDCDIGSEYKYYLSEPRYGGSDTGIKKRILHDKKELDRISVEFKKYKKLNSQWSEDNGAYNTAVKESNETIRYVEEIIDSVKRESGYISRAKDKYCELLELADNNEQIAYNFFVKAYPKEETKNKLGEYFGEDSTYKIKTLSYEGFIVQIGIELQEDSKDSSKS